MRVAEDRRELGEVSGQLVLDLFTDGTCTVLQFGRGLPTRHNIVGINLKDDSFKLVSFFLTVVHVNTLFS